MDSTPSPSHPQPAPWEPSSLQPAAPRGPGGTGIAAIAWIVAMGLSLFFFIHANMPEPPKGSQPPPPPPTAEALAAPLAPPGFTDSLGRIIMGVPVPGPNTGEPDPRLGLLPLVKQFSQGSSGAMRSAMIEAEVAGAEKALESLDKLDPKPPEGSTAAKELALVIKLLELGPDSLSIEEREHIKTTHGFVGRVALTRGSDRSDPERAEVLTIGEQTTVKAMLILLALGGYVLCAVIACVIVGAVFLFMGRVQPRLLQSPSGAPLGSVYIETFAVFMLAMFTLREVGPLFKDALGTWAIALQWLVAPTVFYPLLRGVSWPDLKAAMGWHTGRGLFRELATGFVGYYACAPVVAIGIVMTLICAVIRTMFVGIDAEPPSNPVGELIAGADPLLLFLVASLATVWAPLVEESIFRGALYRHLRGLPGGRGWHWLLAGLFQGVVFAAIHPQGWIAIPALASLGFSFSMLREWRTSLIPAIVGHALHNGSIVLLISAIGTL